MQSQWLLNRQPPDKMLFAIEIVILTVGTIVVLSGLVYLSHRKNKGV